MAEATLYATVIGVEDTGMRYRQKGSVWVAGLLGSRPEVRIVPALRRTLGLLRYILQVYRGRRQLARLGDAALHDLGLSRADALRESERSFWDLPER